MLLVIVIGGLLLAGIALGLSYVGDTLEPEPLDAPDPGLPDRPLVADDVPRLRFRVGLRGYRMADVDAAMRRLEASLRAAESGSQPTSPAADAGPRQQP